MVSRHAETVSEISYGADHLATTYILGATADVGSETEQKIRPNPNPTVMVRISSLRRILHFARDLKTNNTEDIIRCNDQSD